MIKTTVVNGWPLPMASALVEDLHDHWKSQYDAALDERDCDGVPTLPVRLQWDEDECEFALRFDVTIESFGAFPIGHGELDLAEDPYADDAEAELYALAVALIADVRVMAEKGPKGDWTLPGYIDIMLALGARCETLVSPDGTESRAMVARPSDWSALVIVDKLNIVRNGVECSQLPRGETGPVILMLWGAPNGHRHTNRWEAHWHNAEAAGPLCYYDGTLEQRGEYPTFLAAAESLLGPVASWWGPNPGGSALPVDASLPSVADARTRLDRKPEDAPMASAWEMANGSRITFTKTQPETMTVEADDRTTLPVGRLCCPHCHSTASLSEVATVEAHYGLQSLTRLPDGTLDATHDGEAEVFHETNEVTGYHCDDCGLDVGEDELEVSDYMGVSEDRT